MKPAAVTLSGELVRLEPLSLAHLPDLLRAAGGERATFALTQVPEGEPALRRYIEAAREQAERGAQLPFATVDARHGVAVGSTRFLNLERWAWPDGRPPRPEPDAAEIGSTWLAAAAQRSGINTEAKLLMLTHAFEGWGVRRLQLKTDARNARSRRAIERLGARFEGILRAHMPAVDGGVRDTAMYSVTAEEWPAVRAHLHALLRRP